MSKLALPEDGSARTRTEYWLLYEDARGDVRRWMRFTSCMTALEAIPDADRSAIARRWGIRAVEVTERAITETQWQEKLHEKKKRGQRK